MKSLCTKATLLGGMTTFGFVTMSAAFAPAEASDRLIRRCSADGAGDISMAARYEVRDDRRKFTVEFEAATPGAFRAGQTIIFLVADRVVGRDTLEPVVGGDLVGELDLDTQAGPGDDEAPFPRNFPPVRRGTNVTIKTGAKVVLGCDLR